MKILILQYEMMDLGGIVGDLEALYRGLTELGHSVEVRQLVWKENVRDQRTSKEGLIVGSFGLMHDQTGWIWPANMRIAYKGPENIRRFLSFASGFDGIIWHMPVPSKNAQNQGNIDWLELYESGVPQIAYCHDGNFPKSYPWLTYIQPKLKAVVATQEAALGSLRKHYSGRSALVLSGQVDINGRMQNRRLWENRLPGVYSNFTAKGWKHLEDYVRAVPHMRSYPLFYIGNGITLRYMKSKDKCKPEFHVRRKEDPDIGREHLGKRIWDLALEHGLVWKDYVHPHERDDLLVRFRLHLDPSWSKAYAKYGAHFNRTTVEAMIAGTVPVARNLGLGTDEKGESTFFSPGNNYWMIPWNATPKEFAESIFQAANMTQSEYESMLHNWGQIIHFWDYLSVAERVVNALTNEKIYEEPFEMRPGKWDKEIYEKGRTVLNEFFSGEKISSC